MKKILIYFLLLSVNASAQLFPNLGGQRAGVSSLTFLKSDVSPVSNAMGGSSVALKGTGYASFHNPASVSDNKQLTFAASNLFIGNGIHQSYLSALYPFKDSSTTLAFTLNNLSSGAMEVRTEFQPDGTGEYFYVSDLSAAGTFSRQLSEMFSMGLTAKYIREQIAEYKVNTAAVDLGFKYKTDYKALTFAVAVKNFGGNSSLKGSFLRSSYNRDSIVTDNFGVPTTFQMGMTIIPYQKDNQVLLASIQLDHPNDNAENIRLGAEYQLKKILFLRGGYKFNVEGQSFPTAGFGYRTRIGYNVLFIDYAVNPTRYLGMQHCIGLSFILNNNRTQTDEKK
jgi:hypothetical protein